MLNSVNIHRIMPFWRKNIMKKVLLVCIVVLAVCIASGKYTPTEGYTIREIEGWKVFVNKDLLSGHPQLAEDVLKLLQFQLYQITRIVPAEPLKELRNVPFWVEYNAPRHQCMCYHPSERWLRNNDFNPQKERSVEIANAENFLKWTIDRPWMVLHELAHAYHHCVLGHDNAELHKTNRYSHYGEPTPFTFFAGFGFPRFFY